MEPYYIVIRVDTAEEAESFAAVLLGRILTAGYSIAKGGDKVYTLEDLALDTERAFVLIAPLDNEES